jgi:hypothetical protein
MIKLKSFLVKDTEGIIPKIDKILSEVPVKPAEILNPFSFQSFSFLNFTLLGFFDKTLAEFLNN